MTDRVRKRDVTKIRGTGNYIFKGVALETYEKIMEDLGDQAVLTSGVRSVTKQFMLFLNKALKHKGNLSLASRSLAPPGYSYHGVGDFDMGQVDFGADNFTERFTTTEVCRKLEDLGYVNLRYQRNNSLGVRFEPWHIKVT
jgi:LAS superfamily LD-carboxypeptidase LdcB